MLTIKKKYMINLFEQKKKDSQGKTFVFVFSDSMWISRSIGNNIKTGFKENGRLNEKKKIQWYEQEILLKKEFVKVKKKGLKLKW